MKSNISLIVLIINLAIYAEVEPRYGVSASAGLSYYSGEGFDSYLISQRDSFSANDAINNRTIGGSLNFLLEFPVSSYFTFHSELGISGAGGGYLIEWSDQSSSHLVTEINLDLTLMCKYYFNSNPTRFFINAGPVQSHQLENYEHTQNGSQFDKGSPGSLEFAFFGVGIALGTGLEIPLSCHTAFFELRYQREFTETVDISDFYQNMLRIYVGLYPNQGGQE